MKPSRATIGRWRYCFDEAVASFDKAIALGPDHAEAYFKRGSSLQELKRFDEAVADYDRTLKLLPDHADAHCNRSVALNVLRRFDEALASHDRYGLIQPEPL